MGNKKKKDLSLKGESNELDYQYPEGAEPDRIKVLKVAGAQNCTGKIYKHPQGKRALL